MEYLIPNYKLPILQKEVARLRNKGAIIVFDLKEPHIFVKYKDDKGIDCAKVDVEGTYKINGWVFVGIIEHASPENIIRLADYSFEGRVPERYRTAGRDCEHCHIVRDRNDTYLVYNEDLDEFKQVGKTCLKSYTDGLNAETCAALCSFQRTINLLDQELTTKTFDDELLLNLRDQVLDMDYVKKFGYNYIKEFGYTPMKTKANFLYAIRDLKCEIKPATSAEIEEVTRWLETTEQSDYIRNCKAAWNKEYFEERDCALILSAIYTFFKWKQLETKRKIELDRIDNTAAGNAGDKVKITIESVQILYKKVAYTGYRNVSYPVYKIIGTDGKVYVWSCSSNIELSPGMILTGTIKKISNYKGEVQTEITRCKVI